MKSHHAVWGESEPKALKISYKNKDAEVHESLEGDSTRKITLPEPAEKPPERVWAVVWHVSDHAECETFLIEDEAKAKFDELDNGSWAAMMYDDEMTELHRYSGLGEEHEAQCRDAVVAAINEMKL